jgi:hypothetical protein
MCRWSKLWHYTIVLKSLADIIRFEYMAAQKEKGQTNSAEPIVSASGAKVASSRRKPKKTKEKPTPTHPNHHNPKTRPLYTRTENMLIVPYLNRDSVHK